MLRSLRSSARITAQSRAESKENFYAEESSEEDTICQKKRGRKKKIGKNAASPPKIRKKSSDDEPEKVEPESPTGISKSFSQKLLMEEDSSWFDSPQVRKVKAPKSRYSSARKALTSNENFNLPGREEEIAELKSFIDDLVARQASGSLYVSGQPGTGKTASLMKIMQTNEYKRKVDMVYINCTSVVSVGAIYKRIVSELDLECDTMTEKGCLECIEDFLQAKHKMVMLVLDEIDHLTSKKQAVLCQIFEWPSYKDSRVIIVGIANALDLTDRLLTRLQAKCELKPRLMHYKPYSREQIVEIFRSRLEEAGVLDLFPPTTLKLLAAKVAAVSGDVRRALDIGRRVAEIAESQKTAPTGLDLQRIESEINTPSSEAAPVQINAVLSVVNSVYGTAQKLDDDEDGAFPLQQKLLICALLLIIKHDKHKALTLGRLHDVYKRVCTKRNLMALDQAEFTNLCSLVEVRGIIRLQKKKENRLSNVWLQWNEDEVNAALRDKQLIAEILCDKNVLNR